MTEGASTSPIGTNLTFDPAVASDILSDLSGLNPHLHSLLNSSAPLVRADSFGKFESSSKLQQAANHLGQLARDSINEHCGICDDISSGVQSAAKNLLESDLAAHQVISQAGVDSFVARLRASGQGVDGDVYGRRPVCLPLGHF